MTQRHKIYGLTLVGLLLSGSAFAIGGGTLPFMAFLNTLATEISGPFTAAVGIISIAGFGLAYATGAGGAVMTRASGVFIGLSIAFTAVVIAGLLGLTGGLMLT